MKCLEKELGSGLGNGASLKLVLIQAGKFLMGSTENETHRDGNEAQREVTISKPFYMGVTHMTVDQLEVFVKYWGDGPAHCRLAYRGKSNPSDRSTATASVWRCWRQAWTDCLPLQYFYFAGAGQCR